MPKKLQVSHTHDEPWLRWRPSSLIAPCLYVCTDGHVDKVFIDVPHEHKDVLLRHLRLYKLRSKVGEEGLGSNHAG
jgi:hypothetical protein